MNNEITECDEQELEESLASDTKFFKIENSLANINVNTITNLSNPGSRNSTKNSMHQYSRVKSQVIPNTSTSTNTANNHLRQSNYD